MEEPPLYICLRFQDICITTCVKLDSEYDDIIILNSQKTYRRFFHDSDDMLKLYVI